MNLRLFLTTIFLPYAVFAEKTPWERYLQQPTPANAKLVEKVEVRSLENTNFFDDLMILEKQVIAGDVESIRLAYRLRKEADGAYAEILDQIQGSLIRVDAKLFLVELSKNPQFRHLRLPSILGNLGPAYVDRYLAQSYELKKRLQALEAVSDKDLKVFRDLCLKILKVQIKIRDQAAHQNKQVE